MSVLSGIKHTIWRINKRLRDKKRRKAYVNRDVSIISMNCTGGILYHDLGLQFLSPTVNMYFKAEDFIKFCENIDKYLAIDEMIPCTDSGIVGDRTYPVAYLGDLVLYLVHYKSVEEAQQKWNARKQRINKEKIVIIDNDREGMTSDLMDRFERLPYKKVMFTHLPEPYRGFEFHYIPGYEMEDCVGIITDGYGWTGLRPIDQFDWVKFLNEV